MSFLENYPRKKISIDDIQRHYRFNEYAQLVEFIAKMNEQEILKPVVASGGNGKRPQLFQLYWIQQRQPQIPDYSHELQFQLLPRLQPAYYLSHPKQYCEDRGSVLAINQFFQQLERGPEISLNERSFQIFGQEKFLATEGIRILKNLGLTLIDLHVYESAEPLAYYTAHKRPNQNVLIIENKDTFYSMRMHLAQGARTICGLEIGTLIYGGGKRVVKAFRHFQHSVEPYLLADQTFYYFGDLDYEGIVIYDSLRAIFACQPFVAGYEAMLSKAANRVLPATKAGQNRHIQAEFFTHFDEPQRLHAILARDIYIPQEILTQRDL